VVIAAVLMIEEAVAAACDGVGDVTAEATVREEEEVSAGGWCDAALVEDEIAAVEWREAEAATGSSV
jgi:hypothetical protein